MLRWKIKKKEYEQEEWKIALHSEILSAVTGNQEEKRRAYGKVGYYYQCCAPASLYKYYSDTTQKLNAVKNNKMWYSAPCNFNDVFDCDVFIDREKILDSALQLVPEGRKVLRYSPMWQHIKRSLDQPINTFESVFQGLKHDTGIACLTESCNSLLMWAHYANNHKGMCVEYSLWSIADQLHFTPVPVIYSNEKTRFSPIDMNNISKDAEKLLIEGLTSKSTEWAYENEWRIIRDDKACGDRWNAEKQGALLDMIPPSSVILGCAAEPDFESQVVEYCQSSRINLYKMEKDPIHYRLNKKAVLEFDKED